MYAVMIWGPPGIGKSSIVQQIADDNEMQMTDVRLSQLAPTDLRGLPVPDKTKDVSKWFSPDFLPRSGKGILFLDEMNMAPPVVQGIAQQLILDRKVGSYVVPEGWFIWAAGNRKSDKASVFDMPAPLANRFLHVSVEPDIDSFRYFASKNGLAEEVIACLSENSTFLHKMSASDPAWPSPRAWAMASKMHLSGLSVVSAVGPEAASKFINFLDAYKKLPDIEGILKGAPGQDWPSDVSERWATAIALATRPKSIEAGLNGLRWISSTPASEEYRKVMSACLTASMEGQGLLGEWTAAVESASENDAKKAPASPPAKRKR
jgi:MoxR-like ATPase